MQFTSEEVQKLKRQQQQHKQQQNLPPVPPPKPRTSASGLLESSFEDTVPNSSEVLIPAPKNLGIHSKSTPSLEQQPQLSPRSTTSEPQAKISVGSSSSGIRWKNSLDSLNRPQIPPVHPVEDGIPRGFIANPVVTQPPSMWSGNHATSHSHSNSDSGLSSLSGRASTMSPISTMSTVSSVSSASSSGSSSRASLRSASIVSSCTIPLDEEDEDDLSNQSTITTGTSTILSRKMAKTLPEESQCELLAQQLLDMLSGAEGAANHKKLVSLIGKAFFITFWRFLLRNDSL